MLKTDEISPLSYSPTRTSPTSYHAYGWRLDRDHAGNLTLVTNSLVSALLMPSDLGVQVHRVLSIHMLTCPVIGYADEHRWAFLAEPDGACDAVPDGFADWQVTTARSGTSLPLPPAEPSNVRWIDEPDSSRSKPPWRAVISATRRVLSASAVVRYPA